MGKLPRRDTLTGRFYQPKRLDPINIFSPPGGECLGYEIEFRVHYTKKGLISHKINEWKQCPICCLQFKRRAKKIATAVLIIMCLIVLIIVLLI